MKLEALGEIEDGAACHQGCKGVGSRQRGRSDRERVGRPGWRHASPDDAFAVVRLEAMSRDGDSVIF